MAIDKDMVPRETPPLSKKGPMVEIDIDMLEDRLARMSDKDRQRLLDLLKEYDVLLKR